MPCYSSNTVANGTTENEMDMLLPHMCTGCVNVCAVRSTALPVTQIGFLSFGKIPVLGYKVPWDPKHCYGGMVTSWGDILNRGGRSSGRGRCVLRGIAPSPSAVAFEVVTVAVTVEAVLVHVGEEA